MAEAPMKATTKTKKAIISEASGNEEIGQEVTGIKIQQKKEEMQARKKRTKIILWVIVGLIIVAVVLGIAALVVAILAQQSTQNAIDTGKNPISGGDFNSSGKIVAASDIQSEADLKGKNLVLDGGGITGLQSLTTSALNVTGNATALNLKLMGDNGQGLLEGVSSLNFSGAGAINALSSLKFTDSGSIANLGNLSLKSISPYNQMWVTYNIPLSDAQTVVGGGIPVPVTGWQLGRQQGDNPVTIDSVSGRINWGAQGGVYLISLFSAFDPNGDPQDPVITPATGNWRQTWFDNGNGGQMFQANVVGNTPRLQSTMFALVGLNESWILNALQDSTRDNGTAQPMRFWGSLSIWRLI